MHGFENAIINVDGLVTPAMKARVPVLDRGFLYGDSVYEVFRTYDGVAFLLDEHFARLAKSAELIHLRMTQSAPLLLDEIRRTIQEGGFAAGEDLYVRFAVTRGAGAIDLNPDPSVASRYVIIARPLPRWPAENYSVGVTLAVPEVRRNPVTSLDPNIKGGNYLNNILGVLQAKELGADDCVMLSQDGLVAEASNSNVWFDLDGMLVTPGPKAGNLLGLTKGALHDVLHENSVASADADIPLSRIADAAECFLTSATREVLPVKSVLMPDGKTADFPAGGGDKTRFAMQAFKKFIASYVESHRRHKVV